MRRALQVITAVLQNSYISGFINGRIYKGQSKQFCVPGLNCYSCPGAWGSCPLGSLQAVIGSIKYNFSYYVVGLLLAFGLFLGRFVCGFLCPFGLIQELLYKIPFKKTNIVWKHGKYLKFAILLIFVIAMPLLITNRVGMSQPAFCQYICPAGTLTAGYPLLSMSKELRATVGALFTLKSVILFITLLGSLSIYRFFCKYLCPLGAIYALFNRISLYQLRYDEKKCTHCKACSKACKMDVTPYEQPDSFECIRCGDCVKACKFGALKNGFSFKSPKSEIGCKGCKNQKTAS